jgi:iron uptake system component EfeO
MPSAARGVAALGSGLVVLAAVTGCVSNAAPAGTTTTGAGTITVTSSADACDLSATTAPSGRLTFAVSNTGTDVTEFYLYASDGRTVVGEVENVGPGLSRTLVVQARPGSYVAACKPGMTGDGIRHDVTVTDSGTPVPTADAAGLAAAETAYVAYVRDEVDDLLTATQAFATAVKAGDDEQARSLYPAARAHYERVEPVAESFGELDGLLDARQADLSDGQTWSGWHLLEKDLWPPAAAANGGAAYTPLTADQRAAAADDLVANTRKLVTLVHDPSFTFQAFQITNGAKELLDEVATGKVTGEEEIWSHTDLSDFRANVDGAKEAYTAVANVVRTKNAPLADELDQRFAAVEALLAQHGSIDSGFTPYDQLTPDQVKQLAAAVDALSEPLSELTTAVTGA